jgi:cobalt transporter subunit CbtA
VFRRIVLAALVAGAAAGIVVSAVQMARVVPLILEAERFETAPAFPPVSHDGRAAEAFHGHDPAAWAPGDGLERTAYTALANVLTGIGFALLLTGGFALRGREMDWRRGMLWGLAGFAAFSVAPSLGLPPELPGMAAGDLRERQLWWAATAAATAAALALIAFRPRPAYLALAALLLVAPHAVGAPAQGHGGGAVPAELAARFAVASLVATGLFWIVLGAVAGHLYRRLG